MEKTEQKPEVTNARWFKILISVIGIGYSFLLGYFAYITFFYDIEYTNKIRFAIVGAVISVAFCFLFLYTRESPITCIVGMLNMLLFFPTLMLDWGNWPLLIPSAAVTLFCFFCCHMNDTVKTVFGTIFLLIYIIGGIAFYFVVNFFQVSTVDTLIEEQVSPSGQFRYYKLDVQNNASGKLVVYVQPNTLDKNNGMFSLKTTIRKVIKQSNKPAVLECSWDGENLIINDEVYFTESEYASEAPNGDVIYSIENNNWTYTYFDLNYPISQTINSIKNTIEEKIEEDKAEDNKSDEDDVPDIDDDISDIDDIDDDIDDDIETEDDDISETESETE